MSGCIDQPFTKRIVPSIAAKPTPTPTISTVLSRFSCERDSVGQRWVHGGKSDYNALALAKRRTRSAEYRYGAFTGSTSFASGVSEAIAGSA